MHPSFRPALESLEDRCTLSASPAQSLGSVAVADVQHTLFHVQILGNKLQSAVVQDEIHLDQSLLPLLHGQAASAVQGRVEAHQDTLEALMQQGATLARQDVATDAVSFPLLRALFPAAQ
jgi:hypothetical protein